MDSIRLHAPAKINLYLAVTARRDDGYHDVRMVMQSVDLCDIVTVTRREEPGIHVTASLPSLPQGERNIAHTAAALFLAHMGSSGDGLSIHIEKRIPAAAGLAGGSADAAGVLRALDTLYGTGFSDDTLCAIGLPVGADIPFCIRGGTMLAEGIGECLIPLPSMPPCPILLCTPRRRISTGDAYARLDTVPPRKPPPIDMLCEALTARDLPRLAGALHNDFERVTDFPELRSIRRSLLDGGALGACLSGSGPTFYGLFDDEAAAARCAQELLSYGDTFLVYPINEPAVPASCAHL